jgi:hypothetical protein
MASMLKPSWGLKALHRQALVQFRRPVHAKRHRKLIKRGERNCQFDSDAYARHPVDAREHLAFVRRLWTEGRRPLQQRNAKQERWG